MLFILVCAAYIIGDSYWLRAPNRTPTPKFRWQEKRQILNKGWKQVKPCLPSILHIPLLTGRLTHYCCCGWTGKTTTLPDDQLSPTFSCSWCPSSTPFRLVEIPKWRSIQVNSAHQDWPTNPPTLLQLHTPEQPLTYLTGILSSHPTNSFKGLSLDTVIDNNCWAPQQLHVCNHLPVNWDCIPQACNWRQAGSMTLQFKIWQ